MPDQFDIDSDAIREGGDGDAVSVRESLEKAFDEGSDVPKSGGEASGDDVVHGPSSLPGQEVPPDTPSGQAGDRPPSESSDGAAPATEPMEAPAHWASGDREMFSKQTPEAQKWLMERYQGMESAHTQRSQEIAPIRQFVDQWSPYTQQFGATVEQAAQTLFQTEYRLRSGDNAQKLAVLRELVQAYGVQAPGEGEMPADPRVGELQQQLFQMQAMQQQQAQAAQQQQVQTTTQQVQAFAGQKDDKGNLAHPYFGDVETEMTRLAQADLAAGVQPDLQSLYDRAVWANPTTRAKLMAEQQKASVQKARSAGGSISGAGAPAAEQPRGLRETLEQAYDMQAA